MIEGNGSEAVRWQNVDAAKLIDHLFDRRNNLLFALRHGSTDFPVTSQVQLDLVETLLRNIIEGHYDRIPRQRR